MEDPALSWELTQWQRVIWSQEMLKETIKMCCGEEQFLQVCILLPLQMLPNAERLFHKIR